MSATPCSSECCEDEDCGCSKVCDETYCGRHMREEEAKWAAYFGIRPGMSREERRNQLEAMRPLSRISAEEIEEARALK